MDFIKKIICILIISCFVTNTSYISNVYAVNVSTNSNSGSNVAATTDNYLDTAIDFIVKNPEVILLEAMSISTSMWLLYSSNMFKINGKVQEESEIMKTFVENRNRLAKAYIKYENQFIRFLKQSGMKEEELSRILQEAEIEGSEAERLIGLFRESKGTLSKATIEEIVNDLRQAQRTFSSEMLNQLDNGILKTVSVESLGSEVTIEQLRAVASTEGIAEMKKLIEAEPLAKIDYVKTVDCATMQQIKALDRPALCAMAVYIGKTRLIDNFFTEDV